MSSTPPILCNSDAHRDNSTWFKVVTVSVVLVTFVTVSDVRCKPTGGVTDPVIADDEVVVVVVVVVEVFVVPVPVGVGIGPAPPLDSSF